MSTTAAQAGKGAGANLSFIPSCSNRGVEFPKASDGRQPAAPRLAPPSAGTAQGARSARRRLLGGIVCLLAGIWTVLVYVSWQQFDFARDRAALTAGTLTRLVESWVLSSLGRIDDVAATIEVQLAAGTEAGQLRAALERHRAGHSDLFQAIEVVGVDGTRLAALPQTPPEAGIAATPGDGLVVGTPSTVDGTTLLSLSRPLFDAAGRERARLVVLVDSLRFGGATASLGLPADASFMVMRADGVLLAASVPADRARIGSDLSDTELWRHTAGVPASTFRSRDLSGGFQLFAQRAITAGFGGDAPARLVVTVALGDAFVYAEAERRTIIFGLLAAVLSSALVLAAGAIRRELDSRLRMERALAVSASAVAAVSSGIVVVDAEGDGGVVALNPAFEAIVGASSGNLVGKPWADVVGPHGRDWLRLDKPVREVQMTRLGGPPIWVEIRAAAIPGGQDDRQLIALIVTDVTQRRIAEQAMLRAKNQAEHANRAKSDFLANMSHELRTPLNAILGFSEIISKQLLGPVGTVAYREYANDIYTSGKHLLNIITDILDFAKIEATTLKLEESEIQLGKLLGTCMRFTSTRAAQADVKVVLELATDFPAVWADDLRLKQIVLNLLSNAIKFSPIGETVSIRAHQSVDGGLEIEIADKGCGMSPAELDVALQPFRQIESSMAKRTEGTGLGLPLAKRLIDLHGGALEIDTRPGGGTVARIRLPASRTRPLEAAPRVAAQAR
jgi:PAS domain S-box-containing protein